MTAMTVFHPAPTRRHCRHGQMSTGWQGGKAGSEGLLSAFSCFLACLTTPQSLRDSSPCTGEPFCGTSVRPSLMAGSLIPPRRGGCQPPADIVRRQTCGRAMLAPTGCWDKQHAAGRRVGTRGLPRVNAQLFFPRGREGAELSYPADRAWQRPNWQDNSLLLPDILPDAAALSRSSPCRGSGGTASRTARGRRRPSPAAPHACRTRRSRRP